MEGNPEVRRFPEEATHKVCVLAFLNLVVSEWTNRISKQRSDDTMVQLYWSGMEPSFLPTNGSQGNNKQNLCGPMAVRDEFQILRGLFGLCVKDFF